MRSHRLLPSHARAVALAATAALLTASLLAPGLAQAAGVNLLTNGSFSDAQQLDGWEIARGGTDAVWDTLDRADDPLSGSARISMPEGFPGLVFGLEECVPVTAGAVYDLSGWVLIPPTAGGGLAYVQVGWFESEDCGLGFLDVVRSPAIAPPASDFTLTESTELIAPPGSVAGRVRLVVSQQEEDTGVFTAHFDDARFVPEPGAALLQLVALGSALALRRARPRLL